MIKHSLALIFGVLVGLLGYVYTTKKKMTIKENFLPSLTFKVDRVASPNKVFAQQGHFWSVPGTYQTVPAPRTGYCGSQIKYNLPQENMMAFKAETPFVGDGLITPEGDIVNPITYDRLMFSNKRSRLREHGDPIRGDLPIIPHNPDWFRPSVQPHIDLKEGAMQVMGGYDNETNNKLSLLMAASAGNNLQTFCTTSAITDTSGDSCTNTTDVNLIKFMSEAPRGSNVVQGFDSTGMLKAC